MYISRGNMKMSIPTWSLPTGVACPNSTPMCERYCYAKKAERFRKQVLPCRVHNYEESQRESFVPGMIRVLERRRKLEFFRIHESGDFYSQEYLEKWLEICKAFPNTRFLAFSNMWNLEWKVCPRNLVVFWSIWEDTDIGDRVHGGGLFAFIGNSRPELCVEEDVLVCPGHCDSCLMCFMGYENQKHVRFKIH